MSHDFYAAATVYSPARGSTLDYTKYSEMFHVEHCQTLQAAVGQKLLDTPNSKTWAVQPLRFRAGDRAQLQ